jgi:hypothetical protein
MRNSWGGETQKNNTNFNIPAECRLVAITTMNTDCYCQYWSKQNKDILLL